jgi:DNA-binding NarL/FixJ family response regulator
MRSDKRIIIVDDHPPLREGLKSILLRDGRYIVVGECGTAEEGIALIKEKSPNAALIDITLPGKSGFELIRQGLEISPDMKALVVSMHTRADFIAEAFKAGAHGYMAKDSASSSLVDGLDRILNGEHFMDQHAIAEIVDKLKELPLDAIRLTDTRYNTLTPREQEVLRFLVRGTRTSEIANQLYVSPKTIENHKASIMNKLGIENNMQLFNYAIKIGLIEAD